MARPADLGSGFLRRVRIATAIVGGLGMLVLATYIGYRQAAAALAGLVLSLVNLALLEQLFRWLLVPSHRGNDGPSAALNDAAFDRTRMLHVLLALGLKLPLLLGGVLLALGPLHLPPLWFVAGFSLLLAVVLLKAIGWLLTSRMQDGRRWRWINGRLTPPSSHLLLVAAPLISALWFSPVVSWADGRGTTGAATFLAQSQDAPLTAQHEAAPPARHDEGVVAEGAVHGEGGEKHEEKPPELPNAVSILEELFPGRSWTAFLVKWENPIFSTLVIIFLCVIAITVYRRRTLIPGKLQNLVELLVESFSNFILGILGPRGKEFIPFLGTLFFYIWLNNLMGLIPFLKSPTSVFNTTVSLAICVFAYVQYTGLTKLGPWKYLHHMMGSPVDVMGWAMVPLMLPLHLIEEVAKPVSLSLRLFGNILGEDILLGVFAGLGVAMLAFTKLPIGIPLHLPFIFLSILMSTIQALVFTLLATIYFFQMLPHEEHEEGDGH